MAYDKDMQNKFIELRAQDYTLAEIARRLKVSVPTLNKWDDAYYDEVEELKELSEKVYLNEANIRMNLRIKSLSDELEKIYKVLEKRNYKDMKPKDLFSLIEHFETVLKTLLPEESEEDRF